MTVEQIKTASRMKLTYRLKELKDAGETFASNAEIRAIETEMFQPNRLSCPEPRD